MTATEVRVAERDYVREGEIFRETQTAKVFVFPHRLREREGKKATTNIQTTTKGLRERERKTNIITKTGRVLNLDIILTPNTKTEQKTDIEPMNTKPKQKPNKVSRDLLIARWHGRPYLFGETPERTVVPTGPKIPYHGNCPPETQKKTNSIAITTIKTP